MHRIVLSFHFLVPVVAVLAAGTANSTTTSPDHRCDPYLRPRRKLEDALFGTIPSEGWAAHTVESGGLEWLWASPVFVTTNYYKVYPNDTNNQDGPYGGTKFTTNNFPDSIRYSGFRLPTTLQVQQYKPDVPLPNCMAAFANNGSFHCDLGDYLQGDIVTADQGCWHPSCDVVYVRPVGHMDRDYDCDDNDGDGWCNDLDTCVDTPNILQGYAFEKPDAVCGNITLELDVNGFAELTPFDLDNGSLDWECSIAAIEFGTTTFDCGDVDDTESILEYSVRDGNDNAGACFTHVTIVDSTPPNASCQDITVVLNSDGNGFVKNAISADAGSYDNCGIAWMEVTPSVFTCSDVGDLQPLVLAVMDVNGNVALCDAMATVVNESPVWEDPLSSGVAVLVQEESISFQANISDPEGQNLTFAWDMTCSDQETVTFFTHSQQNKAQLVFPTDSPTVCMITVEACDVCGSCLKDSTEVAIVDPKAGSISGNGWFTSPPITSLPYGDVSFVFDAEYKEGNSVPTGKTKIHTTSWEFHSTSYEWLVVTEEGCAKLKGIGAIVKEFGTSASGISEHGFQLTVCDNAEGRKAPKDHGHDTIRIRIWSIGNGNVLYDNTKYANNHSFVYGTILGGGKIEIERNEEKSDDAS